LFKRSRDIHTSFICKELAHNKVYLQMGQLICSCSIIIL
jgi:hypothetical protein